MDTLQDQCGTRTGRVQVQFVILPGKEKEEGNRRGVLDIVDVLKSSEEEPSQEERIREDISLPVSQPEKSKPTRWIVSTEFREIQKALKMPRDPRKWSSSHVRVWLVWARQHFPEVGPYQNHHRNLDGAQMMSLTPSQLQQRNILVTPASNEPSNDLFLTHRDLLRQTGAAAVCEQPAAPPQSIQQQIAQVTSTSENNQRSTTSTGSNAAGSQPIQLWQFLLELLTEPKLVKIISWWGSGISGEFRLHQPEVVASLWGHRKGRPNMTYDKLSRALRYYYEGDMIAKVAGKRFVYRFVLDLKVVVGYSAAELNAQIEQCLQNR
ncbi:GA-binding protein alpha chain-like isoform X2 [Eriocheir sinensis]|nr:GA-binding protein alpha chain-like isoform X2 [Eriocheir sinensis]